MSCTTGIRFHPGELLLSSCARFMVIPLLGLQFEEFLLYEIVLRVVVLFHHSNIHLGRRFDDLLRLIIVSPHMHKVHHSAYQLETDSNYASIFSFWDRIFRSYVYRSDVHNIQYGLDEFTEERWNSVSGMLKTPLEKR